MTSLVSASQVVTGQVQSLDSVRAHALPSDAMIFASGTKVQPANQNLGSYAIVESMGIGVTTTGSVPAVTQSPFADVYKEGSFYFNGSSGNYLSNTATTFTVPTWSSTGMTVECWVNYSTFTNAGATPALLGFMNSGTNNAFSFGANASGVLTAYYWNGSSGTTLTSTGTLSANTWNHIVFCCSSTPTATMYLNGTQVYSAALVGSGTGSIYGLTIGQYSVNPTAYVASVRINFGTPLYTGSSFTVPSAPLSPAATGTNAFLLRVGSNSPTVQNGALTFDRGLKQFMNFGAQNFNIATRGFTAVFKYTWNGAVSSYERIFTFSASTANTNNALTAARNATAGQLHFVYYVGGVATVLAYTGTLNQGTNYVVAFVYNPSVGSGTGQWWVNGSPSGSPITSLSSSVTSDLLTPFTFVGCDSSGAGSFTSMTSNTFAIYNRALSNVEILNAYSALTTATTNAPIEIGDVNGTPALSIAGDGRVNVTKLGQSSNVVPWPPAAMTGYVTSINGGTYVASASGDTSGYPVWTLYDKGSGYWYTGFGSAYNTSAPYYYTGSFSTSDVNGTVYKGDWAQIQLPTQILLSSYSISGLNTDTNPSAWVILGSRDGINWTVVNTQGTLSLVNTTTYTYSVATPSQAFNYFRLVALATGSAGYLQMTEWTLYGTADTAQPLTVSQPVTLSYGAQTASLTGIANAGVFVPQDFSSSGLNVPAYVVSNTATTANTVQYSSFGPFAGEGSVYFPGGTGTAISFPSSVTQVNPFTGGIPDFTFECWIYQTSVPGNLNAVSGSIINRGTLVGAQDWVIAAYNNSGTNVVLFNMFQTGGGNIAAFSPTLPLNQWVHIAATLKSGVGTAFVNGVAGTPTSQIPNMRYNANYSTNIGNWSSLASTMFNGYIAGMRMINGIALYTTSFTPPSGPLQPIQGVTQAGLPYGTVLLLRNAPAPGRVLTSKFAGSNSTSVLPFPPAAMTSYATTLNSGYGQGTYVASASSENPTYVSWGAFDKTASGLLWLSSVSKYNTSAPYNALAAAATTVDVNGTSYLGEWLQIQMPSSVVLSNYTLRSDQSTNFCATWYILGSRDGITWSLVNQQNQTSTSGATTYSFTVTSGQAFTWYRLVTTAVSGFYSTASGTVGIVEWTLNGTIEGLALTQDGRLGVGVSAPVQALEVAGSAVVAGTLSAGNPLMFRNRIINGDFRVDQRAGGVSYTQPAVAPNYGSADRWSVYGRLTSKFSVQQSSVVPQGVGLSNSWLITSLSAYTTVTSDYYGFVQLIEGYNIADFMWGTSYGVPVTVSFWVRSSVAGNYTFNVEGPSLTPSYSVQYAIGGTNSWQYVTITIPPPPSGTTFGALNTTGIRLWWDLGSSDTSYAVTTPGVWQAGDKVRVSGSVNLIATNGATMYITGVQLEKGSVATPFEVRPYATELALCQRYYVRFTGDGSYKSLGVASAFSTTAATGIIVAPTSMRAQPSIIDISSSSNTCAYTSSMIQGTTTHTTNDVYLYSAGVNFGFTTIGGTGNGVASPSYNLIGINLTNGSGITTGWSGMMYLPTGKYIGFSAEL